MRFDSLNAPLRLPSVRTCSARPPRSSQSRRRHSPLPSRSVSVCRSDQYARRFAESPLRSALTAKWDLLRTCRLRVTLQAHSPGSTTWRGRAYRVKACLLAPSAMRSSMPPRSIAPTKLARTALRSGRLLPNVNLPKRYSPRIDPQPILGPVRFSARENRQSMGQFEIATDRPAASLQE